MAASRTARATSRRRTARKAGAAKRPAKKVVKPVRVVAVPQQTMYRLCKAGWSVIVDKVPNAQGTRFVCPFCPYSHRVPGPVRGFRKVRRAQWIKLRRVAE
jgi:hypothetical protein